jgi:hypothetical protein
MLAGLGYDNIMTLHVERVHDNVFFARPLRNPTASILLLIYYNDVGIPLHLLHDILQ